MMVTIEGPISVMYVRMSKDCPSFVDYQGKERPTGPRGEVLMTISIILKQTLCTVVESESDLSGNVKVRF